VTKLALTEVFAAPQGEGYHAGRWAVFVRLAGCPLACEFAPGVVCDTPYMQANLKVSIEELFSDIIPELLGPARHPLDAYRWDLPMLIITGGEPTAQPTFDELVDTAYHTRWDPAKDNPFVVRPRFYVAVETNGTRFRQGLMKVDWISVSPKDMVPQTSSAQWHNHNPQSSRLSPQVVHEMERRTHIRLNDVGGEFRYVIAADSLVPPYHAAHAHYVSPAVKSDGSGEEWKAGFPGFAPGAVERCLEIIRADPRWRISVQTHKVLGVR
jgi:organic radical activating enzyme